jgi:GT2 family glycosyltransferase
MSEPPQPLVSIITVNYNQAVMTAALLESIRRQDYRAVEVFVVDNGSDDAGDVAALAAAFPEVRVLVSPVNLGFAGGNNLALPETRGEYLFFVNNDAELTAGCLERLVALFATVPGLGIVSPLVCYQPDAGQAVPVIQYAGMTPVHPITARNRTIGAGELERGQYDVPRPTAYAHGAAMLVSRAALEAAGPMAEDFFLYYEELDWCERLRRAGYGVWVEPRAHIYHKESATVGRLGALKTYFLNRNRVYFMRRNVDSGKLALFYAFLWLVTVPKNLLDLAVRRDWKALRAFWLGISWNFRPTKNQFERLVPDARGSRSIHREIIIPVQTAWPGGRNPQST